MWPSMEIFRDQDGMPLFDDSFGLPDETPPTTPSEKETTNKPIKEKDPPLGLFPFEKSPILKPLDIKPPFITPETWPPVTPFDILHPSRPSMMWPRYDNIATMRPLDPLRPIEPINTNWDWDLPKHNYKFVLEHLKPPPSAHTGVVEVIWGVVAGFVALLVIINLLHKKNRTRRGVFLAAGAGASDQEILTDSRPYDAGEPGPFKADLPPPYSECYGMNHGDGEEPPPYPEDGAPQDHNPRQNAFIENELTASSANVAPDTRTELVFDNGRIVERLSLDLNSNSHTAGSSSDHAEGQTTRRAHFKDTVQYVDETGNVKGHTQ